MIDKLQAHYGFTRMPFGRDLAPGMLHRHAAHNEAVARITWCITERAIGVITGEVGAGIFLDDARLSADALAGDLSEAQQQLALINGLPSHRRKDNDQP